MVREDRETAPPGVTIRAWCMRGLLQFNVQFCCPQNSHIFIFAKSRCPFNMSSNEYFVLSGLSTPLTYLCRFSWDWKLNQVSLFLIALDFSSCCTFEYFGPK